MIPRIKRIEPLNNFILSVVFYDGKTVLYDVKDDILNNPGYSDLKDIPGLFNAVQLDESHTCVYWNDYIDIPSDIIYEYGIERR